jgi:predicted HicB family RNase H-like nuclease
MSRPKRPDPTAQRHQLAHFTWDSALYYAVKAAAERQKVSVSEWIRETLTARIVKEQNE